MTGGEGTFTGTRGNGQEALKSDLVSSPTTGQIDPMRPSEGSAPHTEMGVFGRSEPPSDNFGDPEIRLRL
jgi:hypothetical protein